MTSRDTILQRVRGELRRVRAVACRPWPRFGREGPRRPRWPNNSPGTDGGPRRSDPLRARWTSQAATGRTGRQAGWTAIGAMDRPMVREATADLPPGMVRM